MIHLLLTFHWMPFLFPFFLQTVSKRHQWVFKGMLHEKNNRDTSFVPMGCGGNKPGDCIWGAN